MTSNPLRDLTDVKMLSAFRHFDTCQLKFSDVQNFIRYHLIHADDSTNMVNRIKCSVEKNEEEDSNSNNERSDYSLN